jgi:hypothetical protein
MRLYLESMDRFQFADGSAVSPCESVTMKFEGRSICARRKHGHIFVWRSSLNKKYMFGKRRLRRRPGILYEDNLLENLYCKR